MGEIMSINMLVFEMRETEEKFFKSRSFEGFNFTFFDECLNEEFAENLSEDILKNATVISISKESSLTDTVLDKFKNLRIVSIRSDDYDQVCISKCKERNIAVINVPQNNTKSVAQFVIGLIINLARNIIPASKISRVTEDFTGRDLSKLTLGLVGTGQVGAEICRIADAIGMKIITHDKYPKCELIQKFDVKHVSLYEMANEADIICVNLEYNTETHHLFNEEFFSKCKDGIYFVSISKSELIDYEALYKYIDNGKIKGAALDTTPCDSICYHCKNLSNKLAGKNLHCLEQTNYIEKLKKFDNVIITPCLSGTTIDSTEYILNQTMQSITETLVGDRLYRIV